jgi:hypothetical protein
VTYETLHAPNERIKLDTIQMTRDVYSTAIHSLLGTEPPSPRLRIAATDRLPSTPQVAGTTESTARSTVAPGGAARLLWLVARESVPGY